MTQEKLNALQLACENLQHSFRHALGMAILCGVAYLFLYAFAGAIDEVLFESEPICRGVLFFGLLIAIGIWLL